MDPLTLMSLFMLSLIPLQMATQETKSFRSCDEGWVAPDSPIANLTVSSTTDCARSCYNTKTCLSFNICDYKSVPSQCYLLSSVRPSICGGLEGVSGCYYVEKLGNPCQNGGTWNYPLCTCVDGYAGQYCERYIRSCQEGWDLGVRVSRFYMVQPFGSPVVYRLHCNLQYSKVVSFFVRYRNPSCPSLSFDKTWREYKEGFGDLDCGEYFLGLESIHQLMEFERFQLHVFGVFTEESTESQEINYFYNNFTVLSETRKFRMNYGIGFNLQHMQGDDGLGTEKPRDFCTHDRDCGSCAVNTGGGWWYSTGCGGHPMTSSLNNFLWPVDGRGEALDFLTLQLDHMSYL